MRTPEIEKVLNDFSASDWLKRALRDAMDRDAVDAAQDAEVLAYLLRERLEVILPGTRTLDHCALQWLVAPEEDDYGR